MKNLILAVNISEKDFSPSNISKILMVAFEKAQFNDLVLFLPRMGRNTEEFLLGLSKCCEMLGDSFCTDVFLEEEDKESISFDFLTSLKRVNPNFSVHSKEDEVYIGEYSFKWFDVSKGFALDEFTSHIGENVKGIKKNYAVASVKDEVFLKRISKRYSCISLGDIQIFSRRYSRDYAHNKLLLDKDEYINDSIVSDKSCDCDNDIEKVNNEVIGPVLKLIPQKNKKSGK